MCSNKEKMSCDEPDRIVSYFSLAQFAINNGIISKDIDQEEIVNYLLKFNCNNFGIVDSLFQPYASGVYPIGALVNHSCLPNCVITYDKYFVYFNNNRIKYLDVYVKFIKVMKLHIHMLIVCLQENQEKKNY